ncbi:MAG: hypothetical protein ABJP48_01040 [Erythrobacter sp.]
MIEIYLSRYAEMPTPVICTQVFRIFERIFYRGAPASLHHAITKLVKHAAARNDGAMRRSNANCWGRTIDGRKHG